MPLYLDQYGGTGTKDDPFRPLHAEGKWAGMPLAGRCLLYSPVALPQSARLENIADSPGENLTSTRRNRIFNALGENFGGRDNKVDTVLADLLFKPRSNWSAIKPSRTRAIRELVLQDTVWASESVSPLRQSDMDPTDDFTRANESPLAGAWSRQTGSDSTFNLSDNKVLVLDGTSVGTTYYWNLDVFDNDQFSEVTASNVGGTFGDFGPACRASAGAFSLYLACPRDEQIYRIVAGTYTALASISGFHLEAGDIIGIEGNGSTIRAFKDGVSIGSSTDTAIASGKGGIWIYDPAVRISKWSGGDLIIPGSYDVLVAWDPSSLTNITDDVVKVNISRPLWSLFDPVTPGEAKIEVINVSGKYTPDNPSGPFAGLMKNGRQIKIYGHVNPTTSRQMFEGYLDEISLKANDVQNGRALLSFRDRARELRHRIISTSLWVDYNISSLFENVLVAAGVHVGAQNIQTMPDEADLGWFRDQPADSAISDMLAFNFSNGYVTRLGVIKINGRNNEPGTVTKVVSFNQFLSLGYSISDDRVINDARFESSPRQVSSDVSTLSYILQQITIPASSSVSFVMEYLDPVTRRAVPAINMIIPVSSADYTAATMPSGSLADATDTTSVSVEFFGETAVSTVFNGIGDTVYLNKFQLRGRHIPDAPKLQVITISGSSQAVYGRRSFFLSSSLLGRRDYLQGYGRFLVDRQQDPIPTIMAVVRNDISSESLGLDPGDLISISNSNTAIGSLHFIKRVEHDIDMSSGLQHTISLELERFTAYVFGASGFDSEIWTLDDPDDGRLDSGKTLGF